MKNNTKDLQKQADKLQQDLDKLKEIIENQKQELSTLETLIEAKSDYDAFIIALEIVNGKNYTGYSESNFIRKKDWITYQLETIIKAANYIDNDYQIWKPNFKDNSYYKYFGYLYFSHGSWVAHSSAWIGCFAASGPVDLYYKNNNSCKLIINRFKDLYIKYMGLE